MMPSLAGLCVVLAVSTPPDDASGTGRILPGAPISPDAPWAVAPEGPRSHLEVLFGEPIDPTLVEPIRDGNLMFDGESLARTVLEEQGLPIPALDHEPTAGILYLAMDGVTLRPNCNGFHPQQANAALNCSPLVGKETVFPIPQGGDNTKAVVFQELQNYYKDFNLVMTTNRPPDYLPYTMAVIGGTAQNAGLGGGVCGVANVACDGAKRNHVSLSFPSSCVGVTAEVAAQETAHNWGLEHVDVQADLMYPFVAGGSSFRDECMDISHATGNGVTQCTYVHKLYCPNGGGEEQNSHAELLGVFGPRVADTIAPEIVKISPADGTVFKQGESFLVAAEITDDNNMVGVRWDWLEGFPDDFAETGYHRCTNDVCRDTFPAWRPIEGAWDFINLIKPPPGTYKFKLEVMDAYGNSDSATITVTVEGDVPDPPGMTSTSGSESESSTETITTTVTTGGPGSDSTGGNTTPPGTTVNPETSGTMMDDDESCNCRTEAPGRASWLLLLAGLLPLRRRRSVRT